MRHFLMHFLMHLHKEENSELHCALVTLTEAQIKTILSLRDSLATVRSDFRQIMHESGNEWSNVSALQVTGLAVPEYYEFDCGLIEDGEQAEDFWHLQKDETACSELVEHDVIELTDKDLEIKRVRLEKSWEADDRAPKDFEDIAANMDCDEMLISEDGVYWASYEDYSGSRVETVPILYSLLEKKK